LYYLAADKKEEIPLSVFMAPYLPPKDQVRNALWLQQKIHVHKPKLVWKQLMYVTHGLLRHMELLRFDNLRY